MNFKIKLHYPKTSARIMDAFWLLLLLYVVFLLSFKLIQLTWWQLSLLLALVVLARFWHQRQLRAIYHKPPEVNFVDGQWQMLFEQEMQPIQISSATRVLPWWISLKFKRLDNDKSGALLILKDSLSDADFRHLSRTLRFFSMD